VARGWAIVTGASSGIGREFARELASRGYPILAVARRRKRLEELAKEALARGGRIEILVADLTTEQGVASVVQSIGELSEIEVLINNAGLANVGNFLGATLDRERAAIRLNVDAVVALSHTVLQKMVRDRKGSIMNVASVVAFPPFPHFAVYAATKAFVLSFTEALAEEIRGTGVRILALCPGSVDTELDVFAHNEGILGKLPSLTPKQVVSVGLRALETGRVVKVVGILNRFLPLLERVAPRWTVRRLMGVVVKVPRASQTQNVRS